MTETIERSETHSSFTLERSYPVPVERVWHAFSDAEARDQWFGGEGFTLTEKAHDFRVGGVTMEDGFVHTHTLVMNSSTRTVREVRMKRPL